MATESVADPPSPSTPSLRHGGVCVIITLTAYAFGEDHEHQQPSLYVPVVTDLPSRCKLALVFWHVWADDYP